MTALASYLDIAAAHGLSHDFVCNYARLCARPAFLREGWGDLPTETEQGPPITTIRGIAGSVGRDASNLPIGSEIH